ncbi:MAG: hypothetical protein WCW53_06875 [Syntrophales bacterium]|jgi:hypothetical protein|nr:hypothetical protein [Syntrophales bacterium]
MRDMVDDHQGFHSEERSIVAKDIPVIEILDPYGYVSTSKIIALLKIKRPCGEKIRKLSRTKKDGYVMT